MKTANGIVMIDWDGIALAPREIDLRFYGKEARGDTDFHRAYGLDYQIDDNLITYYGYEWVLQEYNDYVQRLFDMNLSKEARADALDEFLNLFGHSEELGGVVKDALNSPLP
jgi:thiamine kinase-like enzyme